MKRIMIFIASLFLIAGSHAQSLSQGTDGYITVKYLKYDGTNYVFELYNLQGCDKDNIAIQYPAGFTPVSITPNTNGITNEVTFPQKSFVGDSLTLYVEGTWTPNLIFGFQTLTICNWLGYQPKWVYVVGSSPLPVKFISFKIKGNYK